MIYDAVERVHAILEANFATDMAALLTAKSLTTGYVSTVTVVKRRTAIHEAARGDVNLATGPRIGVWSGAAVTQAKIQDGRDSIVMVTMEYVARGSDEDILAIQSEVAAEAIMMSVDVMHGVNAAIGAGLPIGETTVEIMRSSHASGQDYAQDIVTVVTPIVSRDIGL
ncbi:hypothetical protein LCGC14_1673590 [marine sediment metagenome]|uniref:Uncharacterized protein n=1 Tax=marine sediment metagenome TaxID=412755 RepID=A0A0F9HRE8_9ZZZZ